MAARFLSLLAIAVAVVAIVGGVASSARAAVPYGPGALAAVVRDTAGTPVVGALVVAEGPTTRQGSTGLGGLIVLQALPLGTYDVRVTSAGYAPTDTSVVVTASRSGPQYVDLRLATTDLASAAESATKIVTDEDPADDPYVSHALSAERGVDVVPDASGGGSTAALGGTTPLESRVEVDGIPLARNGGTGGLRFRSALALESVDVTPGLASAPRDTALDTIGGTIDYRTPSISGDLRAGGEAGYDSSYGSFQHTLATQTFGPVGVLTDVVTGGGENRSQEVKARYAVLPNTSLGVASYGSQTSALVGNELVTNVAPTSAIDLQTKFGGATLEARTYRSASRTTAGLENVSSSSDDRVAGTQVAFEMSAGETLVSVGYDRRTESASPPGYTSNSNATLKRTYSSVTARVGFPVARSVRLELADAYGGGSQLHRRHAPHVTLIANAGDRLTVRVSAGSAYATMPLDDVAALPPSVSAVAPETSFGYSGTATFRVDGDDRVWASAFALRRFNALAALSQARSRGFDIGFERVQRRAGLGALAYLSLQRAYGFGTLQPFARLFTLPSQDDMQIPGDAYFKARLAVTYRVPNSIDLRVGTTFLGANNALATSGFALGDASLGIALGTLAQARIGILNAFGHRITDPVLASEYAPHEITFSLGRR